MSTAEQCSKCGYENSQQYRRCPQCRFPLMLVAGKYKLEKELAEGGMGQVYLAQHIHLDYDTERVVKVIKPEVFKSPNMDKRFRREVQVTAALSQRNEHIVRIYDDFGEEKGLGHFYIMEFLQGKPLTNIMPRDFGMPENVALHIFYQMCKALHPAHKKKIVHRDLKPDNVFLVQRQQQQHFVKIIDFGIARPEEDSATQMTKGALGTPLYMSPEQCRNAPVDGRSDQYALAIILYEMLSGRNPYGMDHENMESANFLTIMSSHMIQEPVPLAQYRPDLANLSAILQRAMGKDPEQRFPSLAEMWNTIASSQPAGLQLPLLGNATGDFGAFQTGSHSFPTPNTSSFPTPHHTTGQMPVQTSSNKTLWAVIAVLLLAVLGGGTYALRAPLGLTSSDSLQPSPTRRPVRRIVHPRKRIQPIRQRVSPALLPRPAVLPPRPAPPQLRPLRRRKKSRRRIRRRKRRYRRRRRRRSAPRRAVVRSQVGPCGASTAGYRWVWTKARQPRRVQIRFSGCSGCHVVRKATGYCLRVPATRSRVQVQVSQVGYQTCSYPLRKATTRLSWYLKVEDANSLTDENYNCTR